MLWQKYSASPEVFNTQTRQAEVKAWPLRPELVESTLFLYQATKHHSYLDLGERIILDIVNRTKVDCGLAALANVQTGERENRMHSFVLAETLPVSTPTHLLRRHLPLMLMFTVVSVPPLRRRQHPQSRTLERRLYYRRPLAQSG